MIALLDYGAGNLHSVENALKRVGAQVSLVSDGDALARAERIVLRGAGGNPGSRQIGSPTHNNTSFFHCSNIS